MMLSTEDTMLGSFFYCLLFCECELSPFLQRVTVCWAKNGVVPCCKHEKTIRVSRKRGWGADML